MSSEESVGEGPVKTVDSPTLEARIGGGCVVVFALVIIVGIAIAIPEAAYFVAGLFFAEIYRRGAAFFPGKAGRKGLDWQEPDVLGTLWELSEGGTKHVRVQMIADALGLTETRMVREALKRERVHIRETGVRADGHTGPGVHRDDLPPPPLPDEPLSDALTSDDENDDTDSEGVREGMSILVERPNDALTIYRDPAETVARRGTVRRSK